MQGPNWQADAVADSAGVDRGAGGSGGDGG